MNTPPADITRWVIKLGGSLLDLPELAPRFSDWWERQTVGQGILVVGGGELADCIRRADAQHHLGEGTGHWLCIRAMQITAEMVEHLLAERPPLVTRHDLDGNRVPGPVGDPGTAASPLVVLDPWDFLAGEEPARRTPALPCSWRVTSDSIAAQLAIELQAPLVLLKSCLPPRPHAWPELAEAGYVDRHFPTLAAKLPAIRCVDLRSAGAAECYISRCPA